MSGEGRGREGREVWITGAGLLTPLGDDAPSTWRAVRAGRRGVRRHAEEGDHPSPESFRFYGRVEGHADPPEVPPRLASQRKFLNRGSILGLYAAREAIAQAGLDMEALPPERRSLYVGSGDFTRLGHLDFYAAVKDTAGPEWSPPRAEALNETALHKVSPFFLLEGLANNLFSYLSATYAMMGPNGSISSLSACGTQALECCERVLRWDEADVGLVVGCGSWVAPIVLLELEALGLLSRAREGAASFRPFDRRRDGFFPAEGAAALVLEPADAARARGAKPLGRILGTGNFQEGSPERYVPVPRAAVARAAREALREAGREAAELAFILPHGSGTRQGDGAELAALDGLLNGARRRPPLAAWKPCTGHMGAASDVGEIILGLRALAEGLLPPTPGFGLSEPDYAHLPFSGEAQPVEGGAFLSLSHGLGGQSSAALISAP